jgi:hypothetical protein
MVKYLPDNIDTIVIVGCTNGRDIVPFTRSDKEYRCIGSDLTDYSAIDWVCDENKVEYIHKGFSDFLTKIKSLDINLDNTLLTCSATFMYEPSALNPALEYFKNFIVQEPLEGDYEKGKECYLLKDYKKKSTGWERIDSYHIICKLPNVPDDKIDEYLEQAKHPTCGK